MFVMVLNRSSFYPETEGASRSQPREMGQSLYVASQRLQARVHLFQLLEEMRHFVVKTRWLSP